MPGKIKVKVLAGRNLPVMDRASDTTDAFVEIKFGGVTHKTDVCRKSLNPHWNSTEWYRFEVDESELQDEPLQLRLMDHDTYSANDAIGKVVISLAPLLARETAQTTKVAAAPSAGAVMSGWIPVFDTMHGIRGELNVIVKVELFTDFNKYKTSSCGVQFFHCPMIPPGYRASAIHGFVEELVVNDDPEYQWIDKIRTPRASNEARQVAFIKLSNQVQRLVGLKAAELGANAVIGYQQDFDLEGEAGVVARAIGTAVSISPLPTPSQASNVPACSQQQLKKYLDILTTDDVTISDQYQYFQTHQDQLQKLLNILHPKNSSNFLDEAENADDDDQSMHLTRQSSVKSYTDSISIYQDNYATQKGLMAISEDQTDLMKFLNRNEDEEDSSSSGPLQTIKKIKSSFFTKKLGSFKSRKTEKPSDDQISIKSNSSDTSRISLSDIRKEFKKLKRLKKPKIRKTFKNPDDEGVGMASILARSVIHAHTSLACIAETQDSENSPCSTLRRTSGSEPTIYITDEEKLYPKALSAVVDPRENSQSPLPEIHFSSLNNISADNDETPIRHRKQSESCPTTPVPTRGENLLKLPRDTEYYGSVSSALSGDSSEIYSSTEEDDESSDLKTDTEKSLETTTSVVQTVLSQETNQNCQVDEERDTTNILSPKLVVPQRLSVPQSDLSNALQLENDRNQQLEESSGKKAKPVEKIPETFVEGKNTNFHFKFHNPFTHKKSISAPSSPVEKKGFVYRSSKRIKRQLSKFSKSSTIQSLSHYSLIPKRKHVETKGSMSQPGSSSDVPSKANSHETVLGAPFLSYTDLLSLDKESADAVKSLYKGDDTYHPKVEMYIGSEPASRASVSGPSSPYHGKEDYHFREQRSQKKEKHDKHAAVKPIGLIHTAMETILIDKVQSLLIPTTPEPESTAKEKQFFDDVTQKLEVVEEARNKSRADLANIDTKINNKKLTRQNSIHSSPGDQTASSSRKMSNEIEINPIIPYTTNHSTPMLQHFHPILSGAPLETIPSLPESSSIDQTLSLDVDGFSQGADSLGHQSERSDTNSVSVCDNTHAACLAVVGRSERERDKGEKDKGSPKHARHESYGREPATTAAQNSSLNASSTPVGMHRRSSDSDLSITPKGGSLNASGGGGGAILRPSMNSNNLDLLEYPFLTMTEFPPGFIVHLGGCVCARSVKLDGGGEAAARAAWWAELRTELRAHARALRCNAVIAYSETASICEDVCVLSASGTAAVINLDCDFNAEIDAALAAQNGSKSTIEEEIDCCNVAHSPYSTGDAELAHCGQCRRARVPPVILATCAKPKRLTSYAKAVTLTAVAARTRRAPPQAEPGARDISDQLPFLEYELHKLLIAKLRMQGANAIFNLQTQIAIGERCVMALASGTACRLAALPPPTPPRIKASEKDKDAVEIQRALWDTFTANKIANGYDQIPECGSVAVTTVSEVEEQPLLELCADKDAALLELDEAEDVETARCLATRRLHMPVYFSGMKPMPRAPPQAFVQVWRARLTLGGSGGTAVAERHVSRALDGVTYKLRRLPRGAMLPPKLQLELPEDEIQLVVSGTAIQLQDPNKQEANGGTDSTNINKSQGPSNSSQGHTLGTGDADDEIFALDEEQMATKCQPAEVEEKNIITNAQVPTTVSLTSICCISGARIVRRICALRLLFVRETTAVRELGGLSGFLHTFNCEVLAIVRAYTAALGGNSLTSFYITQLMLQDNAHKNQGQCLLSVGGDVVHITY